jgi:hypothetical protein
MAELVNSGNALFHCRELHKVLLNASVLAQLSGVKKTRWSVSEMAAVFDAAWGGRRNWRYSPVAQRRPDCGT